MPEEMGGGHMVSQQEAMGLLRRAEGYCLHKALSAKEEQGLRDYLDAADYLNWLWRGLWKGSSYAQNASQPL